MKNFYQQGGFRVVSCIPEAHGSIPGFRLTIEKDNAGARVLMRMAIAPKAIYHVIAASASGFHDDPAIVRFVDSFTME